MKLLLRSVCLAGLHVIDGPKLFVQYPEPFLSDELFLRFSSLLVPKTELCGRTCWFYESFSTQLFLFDSEELSGESYDRNVFRFTVVFGFEVDEPGPHVAQDVLETQLSAYTVAMLSLCEELREVEQRHAYLSNSFKLLGVSRGPAESPVQLGEASPDAHLPSAASRGEVMASSPVYPGNAFFPSRPTVTGWNSLPTVLRMLFEGLRDSSDDGSTTSSSAEVRLNSWYTIHISLIRQRVDTGIAVRSDHVPVVVAEDSSGGGRDQWSDITLADLYSAIDGRRTVDDVARMMGISRGTGTGGVNRIVAEGLQQLVLNGYVRLLEPVALWNVYNTTKKLRLVLEESKLGEKRRGHLGAFMVQQQQQCSSNNVRAVDDGRQLLLSAALLALHSFVHRSVESVQAKMRGIPQYAPLLDHWCAERLAKIVELGLLNEWLVVDDDQ
jgi:hypothetical protein